MTISPFNCPVLPTMLYCSRMLQREIVHSMDSEDTSRLQNPFLVGERTYLRPLEPAQDNHLYSTWMNDADTRRYFSVYPTSDTRGRERLDQLYKDGKHIIFGVALKSDNMLIGLVGLKDINTLNQSAEFYNIIDRRFW